MLKLYNGNAHYNINPLLNCGCRWNGILSERSNGKSFAVMQYCFIDALERNRNFALVYRYAREITKSDVDDYFSDTGLLKWLKRNTGYDGVTCDRNTKDLYFFKMENGKEKRVKKCGKAFCVELQKSYKSKHYDDIYNIVYEEYIIDDAPYLRNEWKEFNNLCSTIFRRRLDVKIFLLGNTTSRECPYMLEFGIDIYKVKQGSITIAELQKEDGRKEKFAFERCKPREDKESIFFGSADKEITGGEWSAREYPHLFVDLKETEIIYTFFMINELGGAWKCIEFLYNDLRYIYVYPFDFDDVQFFPSFDVFTDKYTESTMQKRNYFLHAEKKRQRRIYDIYRAGRFVYATNLCGTEFNNSLKRYNPFR